MNHSQKPALLIIDMIEDFAKGIPEYQDRFNAVAREIAALAAEFRDKGYPVVYICDNHGAEDFELTKWGPHAMAGTKGTEVVEELKPQEGDTLIAKKTYNAFFETDLHAVLQKLQANPLVITGVLTDICVQYSAVHAFYLGYKIYLPQECMTSTDPISHDNALNSMQTCIGEVVTVKRLEELLHL